jgi:hypothetical protein
MKASKVTAGILLAPAVLVLSACGTTMGDRGLSGAMIGGAAGLVIGGPVAGAVVGAGVGMITDNSQVNLGPPVWD